jgi:hypothetical protein
MRAAAARYLLATLPLPANRWKAGGALVTSAAVLVLAGCGASQTAPPPPPETVTVTVAKRVAAQSPKTQPKPKPKASPQIARPASVATFDGSQFSLDYPASWYVEAREVDKGGYFDTTIRNPTNPNVMVRIDVSVGTAPGDPRVSARRVEASLQGQPGYRRLDFRRIDFDGHPALRWEFVVNERGTLLRKVDLFFENSGEGVAILTQSPAATWVLWRRLFGETRDSLAVNKPTRADGSDYSVPVITTTEPTGTLPSIETTFCDTHDCIQNFDNGVGTIVQCADGKWSHSGGRPGPCSYHGGVAGGASSGSGEYDDDSGSGYTEDYGSGNGYTVVCADGTLSDSGGVQGACSHHGGVGG